jgi:hypothetical protein
MAETVAAQFGQVWVVTLPTGAKVRAMKPSLTTMFASGIFPDELTAHVLRMLDKDVSLVRPGGGPGDAPPDPEAIRRSLKLMEVFIPAVLVDPKIGDETKIAIGEDGVQAGTVRLLDISDQDKRYLFLWGQWLLPDDASAVRPTGEAAPPEARPAAESLVPFRDGEGGGAPDARPGGDALPPAAVEPDRAPAG